VLIILGGMAAVTVMAVNGPASKLPSLTGPTVAVPTTHPRTSHPRGRSHGHSTTTTTSHATTTTEGGGASSIPLAALRISCVTSAQAVLSAASTYSITNAGAEPPAGTAWATSSANGGPYLQSWPSSTYYTIAWNGHTVVVRAQHGAVAVGSAGTSSPPTGCYAL